MNTKLQKYIYGMLSLLSLIGACYFIILVLTPVLGDELMFRNYYWLATNSQELTLSSIPRMIDIVRTDENGRLANILMPYWSLGLPHAVGCAFFSVMLAAIIYGVAVLGTGLKRPKFAFVALSWIAISFTLPWFSGMLPTAMQMNYTPASLLLLFVAWGFAKPEISKLETVAIGICALFAAMLHEGAAVAECCAIGLYLICKRFRLNGKQWIITTAALIGTAVILSSPAIWSKFIYTKDIPYSYNNTLKLFILTEIATIIATVLLFVGLAIKHFRPQFTALTKDGSFIFAAGIAISGFLINYSTNFVYGRSTWFAEIFAVIIIIKELDIFFSKTSAKALTTVGIVSALLCSLFFSGVIYWQFIYYKQNEEIEKLLAVSPTYTVFYDLEDRCPYYTLLYPEFRSWRIPFCYLFITPGETKPFSIVPLGLKDFMGTGATPTPGKAGAMQWNSTTILPDRELWIGGSNGEKIIGHVANANADIIDSNGIEFKKMPVTLLRFTAQNGSKWIYISPIPRNIHHPFLRVDNVTID